MHTFEISPPCECKERKVRSFKLRCGEKVSYCSSCEGLVINPEAEVPEVHCRMCDKNGAVDIIKCNETIRIPLCSGCVVKFLSKMVGDEEEEEEEEEEEKEDSKNTRKRCKDPNCNC